MPDDVVLAVGTVAGLPCDAVVPIDPRHPAAHPGFQMHVTLEADRITRADPRIGFMHRSAEKLFESRDLRQAMLLANRHDWLSPFMSETVTALAAEDALGIAPPERATWTRVLLLEIERVSASLAFLSVVAGGERAEMEQARERITRVLESITGARMHPGFARIGGIAAALDDDDRHAVSDLLSTLATSTPGWRTGVEHATERYSGLARISRDQAADLGLVGPVGRASGLDIDLRRDDPTRAYGELREHLHVPVRTEGDARARYLVLMDQIPVSIDLARHALRRLEDLGEGPIDVALPKVVRLPEGTTYAAIEGALGVAGVLLVGAGDKYPWRMKIRAASFATMQALGPTLVGTHIDDVADAVMSLPMVMGDVDR